VSDLLHGAATVVILGARWVWCKVTGKPFDNGMDA